MRAPRPNHIPSVLIDEIERVANANLSFVYEAHSDTLRLRFTRRGLDGNILGRDYNIFVGSFAYEREFHYALMEAARAVKYALDKQSKMTVKPIPHGFVVYDEYDEITKSIKPIPTTLGSAIMTTMTDEKDIPDGFTSVERFDALCDMLRDLNHKLVPKLHGVTFESEIWFETYNEAFKLVKVITEEPYTFSRAIYSPTADGIRYVLSPVNQDDPDIIVTGADVMDAFPELAEHINGQIDMWPNSFATHVEKFIGNKSALKTAMSKVGYEAATVAKATINKKKEEDREAFYDANPLYGLL